MKKTYSIEELKKLSISIFEQFPTSNELFAAADGNIFVNKNRAELHVGIKGKFETIKRNEVIDESKALNAKDSILKILDAQSIEEIEIFKNDDRKTVKEAYEKKLVELNTLKNNG